MIFCFLFKQKTAYEMRISDWSSDVCSSDLSAQIRDPGRAPMVERRAIRHGAGPMDPGSAPPSAACPGKRMERARQASGTTKFIKRSAATKQSKIGRASCRERVCKYV